MEFACPLERVEQFTVVQLTFLEAARPLAGNLALNEPAEDQVHRLTAGRCTELRPDLISDVDARHVIARGRPRC